MIFGVSPAWFLSLFGEGFTTREAADSLREVKRLGFGSWQAEVFLADALAEWSSGKAGELMTQSHDLGLECRIFVAHFLGSVYTDGSKLELGIGIDELKILLDSLEPFPEFETIIVPVPGFNREKTKFEGDHRRFRRQAIELSVTFNSLVNDSGRRLAFEFMPGNVIGSSSDIAELLESEGLETAGINYDSGHFHAAGESTEAVIRRLGSKIFATHLSDNNGKENLSLAPGDASVPWLQLVNSLDAAGYRGSYDLEIHCPAEDVETDYSRGKNYLRRQMLKETA